MTRPARIPTTSTGPTGSSARFTARQAAILAATATALYLVWAALRGLVAPVAFLARRRPGRRHRRGRRPRPP